MYDLSNEEKGGTRYAWMYFVSFSVIGTFVVLNMFIMIIIENFESADLQVITRDTKLHLIFFFNERHSKKKTF